MTLKSKSTVNSIDELQAQILGLTDNHIHYFAQDKLYPDKKVGIHQAMITPFKHLVSKANKAGISLKIASGFRDFDRQLTIWNNKFKGKSPIKDQQGNMIKIDKLSELSLIKAIMLFSALPGASRHHWGCDIDIYADNLLNENHSLQLEPWEYAKNGPMAKLSEFLNEEAPALGFFFPYDKYRGGVATEPWHLSFAPIAKQYQENIDLHSLTAQLKAIDIEGKSSITNNISTLAEQFIFNTNLSYY